MFRMQIYSKNLFVVKLELHANGGQKQKDLVNRCRQTSFQIKKKLDSFSLVNRNVTTLRLSLWEHYRPAVSDKLLDKDKSVRAITIEYNIEAIWQECIYIKRYWLAKSDTFHGNSKWDTRKISFSQRESLHEMYPYMCQRPHFKVNRCMRTDSLVGVGILGNTS